MAGSNENSAMTVLRWTLGLVIAVESVLTAWNAYGDIHAGGYSHGTHHAMHAWIRLLLGGIETLGAILFLLPGSLIAGGWTLLAVFAFAALFHVLQGQFFVGDLLIYAAATAACMAYGRTTRK